MAKIADYSLATLPQEAADHLEDMKNVINYGKYQIPIVTSHPGWTGRMGEFTVLASSTTWSLMVCTSDQTTRWVTMSNFYP